MSDSARDESLAIISSLRKGHEELLAAATNLLPKKPTFFAWEEVDANATLLRKTLSETREAFPAYGNVEVVRPTKKADVEGGGPITVDDRFTAAAWQSESRAAMALPLEKDASTETDGAVAAGFQQFEGVKQPAFFAWQRLDEEVALPPPPPATEAEADAETGAVESNAPEPEPESAPEAAPAPVPAPLRPAPMGLYEDATPSGWKSEYGARFPVAGADALPPPPFKAAVPASSGESPLPLFTDATPATWASEYDNKFPVPAGAELAPAPTGDKPAGFPTASSATYPKYYAWDGSSAKPPASEYREMYASFEAGPRAAPSKPVGGAGEGSMSDIFAYAGVGTVAASEYSEKYVSAIKAPAPAAADAAAPAAEPAAEQSAAAADPTPAPVPEPAAAEAPLHRTLGAAMNQNAALLFGGTSSAPAAAPSGPAITQALYRSESQARFLWPGPAPQQAAPELPVPPVGHDLIGGTMQTASIPAAQEPQLKATLSKGNKTKLVSETRSSFAWPAKNAALMNRRGKTAARGGDLWVMGHKGQLAAAKDDAAPSDEVKETTPREPTPAVLDALDRTFEQSTGPATEALPPAPASAPVL